MGYTTEFYGKIEVAPSLPKEFIDKWNTAKDGDPEHPYVSAYFPDKRALHPNMMPGFNYQHIRSWCHWELFQDDDAAHTYIIWDGGEKFYNYEEWLQALVDEILKVNPETKFSGEITWQGEAQGDIGKLIIDPNNKVQAKYGRVIYS